MAKQISRLRSEDIDYHSLVGQKLAELDGRAKLVIQPDLRVLWHSANAPAELVDPSPIVLVEGHLSFRTPTRSGSAKAFLEAVEETPSRHLLRSETKGHWALLHAWALPTQHRAIAAVCTLSVCVRGAEESGLAADLRLTRAEAKVLDLFARLLAPQQIAEELGISPATVRSHLKQIYSKAEVETAVQLLRLTGGYCGQ